MLKYYEELELDDEDFRRFGQSRALKKNDYNCVVSRA